MQILCEKWVKGTGGGSRVKNISWAYFIEFFLTNSTLFVSSKNSKYFSSNRVRRAAKIVICRPKNGLKLIKINQNRALKLMKSSNIGHASVSIYTPPETRPMTSYLVKNVQFLVIFHVFRYFFTKSRITTTSPNFNLRRKETC